MFCPLLLNSKVTGVLEDSKFPLLGVWVSSSHLPKVGLRHILLDSQHFGVERRAGTLGWGLRRVISKSITHMDLHKPNNKLVMRSWNIFGAWTSHEQTWIHKTHHNLNLREATTFPLIVFFVHGHETYIQMSFCPRTPKLGVSKFSKWGLSSLWRPITLCADLWLK